MVQDNNGLPPLISIVIPVYNTEPNYLNDCFRPFLTHADSRIELVVVDDGSQQETANYLDDVSIKSKNRITVIHQRNEGHYAARNCGIQQCSGEYIEFLDSDDRIIWSEQLRILEELEKHKPDILGINGRAITPEGVEVGRFRFVEGSYQYINPHTMLSDCSTLWHQLFRRDLFLRTGYDIPRGILIGEDMAAVASLIIASDSTAAIGSDLYEYLQRSTSITHVSRSDRLLDILKIFDVIAKRAGKRKKDYWNDIECLAIRVIEYAGVIRAIDAEGIHSPSSLAMHNYMNTHFPHWRQNPYLKSDPSLRTLPYWLILTGHYRIFLTLRWYRHVLINLKKKFITQ